MADTNSPPSTPTESNTWKWILGGLVVVLIAIGIGVVVYFATKDNTNKNSTDKQTAPDYSGANTNPNPTLVVNIQGVRFIRVQRVRANPMNEHVINISGIVVKYNGVQIPLVGGVVKPQFSEYGWDKINAPGGAFAHTDNQPNSSITVDLGAPKTIDEIVIGNRVTPGEPLITKRIIGCELQVLDASAAIIQKWDFAGTDDATANAEGSKSYKVGVLTAMKLVAFGN